MNNDAPYEICYHCKAIDGLHAHEPYCPENAPAEEPLDIAQLEREQCAGIILRDIRNYREIA